MILLPTCLAGAALFLWPFLGLGVPASAPAVAVCLAAIVALGGVEAGTRQLDSRRLALLATLAALDAALRLAVVTGIGGFSPIFFLVLCAGYVLGPQFGFLAGATSLLVSALVTGGMGPWVPYETFGVAWTGMAAGLCGAIRRRRGGDITVTDLLALAAVAMVLGYLYGAVLDIWDWTSYRGDPTFGWSPGMAPRLAVDHFARYYVTTSLVYDTFRAVGDAVLVLALGRPILIALQRFRRRFRVEVESPLDLASDGPGGQALERIT